MKDSRLVPLVLRAVVALIMSFTSAVVLAENIDPDNDGSQYAYAENAGWMNAEPSGDGGPGLEVGDFTLTGWMWGENTGWISLSCQNTVSCGAVNYGVTNNGDGILSGSAWSEKEGWVSFSCANSASCGAASYGVTIGPFTGIFSGRAWAENIGWITFASPGPNPFGVKTSWRCSPLAGSLTLTVDSTQLSWTNLLAATAYDVVSGSLATLRNTGGDYSVATTACIADDEPATSVPFPGTPAVGEGFWFLLRGDNCGGGTYESGGPGQVGLRDAEIAASGNACP